MTSWWETIQIKKGPGGCGDVTEEQKNDTIDHAVSGRIATEGVAGHENKRS